MRQGFVWTSGNSMQRRTETLAAAALATGFVLLAGQDVVARPQDAGSVKSSRPTVPQGLNFANALLDEKRFQLAEEEYQRFLATNPAPADRASALYGLARAQLFLQKFGDARHNLEAFLQLAPDHPSAPVALFRLGEAAYLMKDLAAAKQALERYVQAYPKHSHEQYGWSYLGSTLQELGELQGARKAFEKALADYPESPVADRSRYALARVLSAQSEPDRAIEILKALAARPNTEWAERARVQIGQIQLNAGRPEEALRTFRTLEGTLSGALLADVRLREAEALLALKEPQRAEAILLGVTADTSTSESTFAHAALALGGIYLDRDEVKQAYVTWDNASKRAAGTAAEPALQYRSAEALEKLGRVAEASARYQSVASRFPTDVWADEALFNAARLALDAKEIKACQDLVNQFDLHFASSPLLPDVRLLEARATQLGDSPGRSIPLFEALLQRESISPETRQSALHFLSQAYTETNQPDRAARALEELARSPRTALAGNARFTLGQSQFDAGHFDEAASTLEAYIREHPREDLAPNALAYVIFSYERLGRAAEMERVLAQLARDWPGSESLTRVRLKLAESAIDSKRFDDAISLLRPVLDGKPNAWTGRASLDLAWALLGVDRALEAAEVLRIPGIKADSPEAAEAAFLRGYALEISEDYTEALAAYKAASKSYADSPQAAKARLACARLLAMSGHPDDAVLWFERVLKEDTGRLPEGERADEILRELARTQAVAGNHEAASRIYERLIVEHPDGDAAVVARLQLAEAEFRSKEYGKARELLRALLVDAPANDTHAPERERAWFRLGRIALDEGKADEARDAFAHMLTSYPMGKLKDEGRFWHAEALYRLGDVQLAEPEFAAVATPSGQAADSVSWRDSARMRRIQCLVALSRWTDVMEEAEHFLADRPNFPQIAELHFARGRALSSNPPPRFDEARAAFQAAIDAAPRSEVAARSQFMRGESFMFEKNHKDAVREFHQVELLYNAPKWQASALLEAGKAYEALNQPSDASVCYKKLLDAFASDPNAQEAQRRLAALKK